MVIVSIPKDKIIFDGNLITNATTKGTSYKIRITNHIRNLIKFKDSTNIKLGLVVTEDINNPISYKVKHQVLLLETPNRRLWIH
jgi:hypothetical protein